MNPTRHLALAGVLIATATAAAAAEPPVPRPVLVRVADLPASLLSEGAWRAWPAGAPEEVRSVVPSPTSAPAWRELVVADALGSPRNWTLVAEAGDRFVIAPAGTRTAGAPALVTVPVVRATPVPGAVRLEWEAPGVPGVEGWELLRSADGRAFEPVARLATDATSATDAAPAGAWTYRLRPVFADGILSAAAGTPSAPEWASATGDRDGDGIADASDRCAGVADPTQADADGDGVSDACEFTRADVAPPGRPDGRVDVGDVVLIMRWAVGLGAPAPDELRAADVAPAILLGGSPEVATPRGDAPAVVGIDDAVLALRASVGLTRLAPPR